MAKGKGKGKKDAGGGEDGAELSPQQVIAMLHAETVSLQRQLAERQEEASKAIASKKEMQQKIVELKQDFEYQREQTYSITADMTRQYKSMQEELLNKINILENSVVELKDKLDLANMNANEATKNHETAIQEKNDENAELKRRMEQMAQEFGDMLKETLDKMSERVEISSGSWENETAQNIQSQISNEYKK